MNNSEHTVSVIISTYNWPEVLSLVLKSIACQTILPMEVIVADDGSTDETRKLIESLQNDFSCKLIHIWQEDKGFRAGQIRNKAIAKASGKYIVQIDGDIVVEKHFIEDHLSIAKDGFFIIGSRVNISKELTDKIIEQQWFDFKNVKLGFNSLRNKLLRNLFKSRYKKNNLYYGRGCNISFWKNDFILVNGYNEELEGWGAEDTELIVRLINSGIKRQFLKFGGVAFHIFHPQLSRDKVDYNFNTVLKHTVDSKLVYCEKGLNAYLNHN